MSKDFRVFKASLAAIITALITGVSLGVVTLMLVFLGLITDVFGIYRDDADNAFWTGIALSIAGALIAAVVVFIILIIVCALLPGDNAAYEGRWEKPVNDRQSKILQSLEENFK